MTAVPIDLVIFDCDGVLVDSEPLSIRADLECLAEAGIAISYDEILERYTGISLAGMVADIVTRYGCALPDFANRHRARLEQIFKAELRAIPGVDAMLDSLSCRCCVASSGTPERIRLALSLVGIYEHFHPHIFSTVEVARGKPAPDLFLHAARRMGIAPEHCVVIEDSLPGVVAAVAAGMPVIGFSGGGHCRPGYDSRLLAAGAALVIDDMARLMPALLDLG